MNEIKGHWEANPDRIFETWENIYLNKIFKEYKKGWYPFGLMLRIMEDFDIHFVQSTDIKDGMFIKYI